VDEALLRQLFATPPPDFVAARNELVTSLRKEKRRNDATAIAGLRRPGWDEWSLNAVAAAGGDGADVVAGFADAAAQVRDAQAAAIEGRDGPDIRGALRDLRDRSAELVRLAGAALAGVGRAAGPGEINARLARVAASDVAVAQLGAGVLGSGDAAPAELFADLEPAVRPATRPATKAKPAPREPAVAERAARAEVARRKAALVEANRLHAASLKARRRAEAELDKARAEVERARAALGEAEARREAAQRELDAAAADEEGASSAADAARAAVGG
jgi:hypothetical protein